MTTIYNVLIHNGSGKFETLVYKESAWVKNEQDARIMAESQTNSCWEVVKVTKEVQ
jgi:hypothetical protein